MRKVGKRGQLNSMSSDREVVKLDIFFIFVLILGFQSSAVGESTVPTMDPIKLMTEGAELQLDRKEETTWYGTKYLIAPITVPIDVAIKVYRGQDMSEIAQEDGKYIIGYATFVIIAGKAVDGYFSTTYFDLNRAIDGQRVGRAKKILVVSTDPALQAALQPNLARTNPGAATKFVTGENQKDLFAQLQALPQDASWDRIDWIDHGTRGKIHLSSGEKISGESLSQMSPINLVREGGELRLVCCLVGLDSVKKPVGQNLVKEIARVLLPNGGSAFASTKVINMLNESPEAKKQLIRILNYSGLAGPIRLSQLLSPFLYSRFTSTPTSQLATVLEIKNEPACAAVFAQLTKWHKL